MTRQSSPLQHSLSGQRREISDPKAGLVSYYAGGNQSLPSRAGEKATPLLLIHSINAAASAHEVKPLYDEYKTTRPTYAIDLPGYGHSERSDRAYLPRLMIDALRAVLREIQAEHPGQAIDALAVSLSCEFLARLAAEVPERFRSLALVSPTGFRKSTPLTGKPDSNRGIPIALAIFRIPLFGRGLYRALTLAPSIRFFLQKTWGSKMIDQEMFENSVLTCRVRGARHAPFHFLSGYLFSNDIYPVLKSLTLPIWMTHGVRGDFTDYSGIRLFQHEPNWRIRTFETGALPYYEKTEQFVAEYGEFLSQVSRGTAVNMAFSEDASEQP